MQHGLAPRRRVRATLSWLAIMALLTSVACRDQTTPPPPPDGPPSSGETVTGRERFGWRQEGVAASAVPQLDYVIFVDGERRALPNEVCTPTIDAIACDAPLPALTPGRHTLELAALLNLDGTVIETGRSSAFTVTVVSATAPVSANTSDRNSAATPHAESERPGARTKFQVVARQLDFPADVAVASDARVFVIERSGDLTAFDNGARVGVFTLPDAAPGSSASIAVDRAFDRTGFLYAAYVAARGDALDVRLGRVRWRSGRFSEFAVLREFRDAPADVHIVLRMAKARDLFLALGAGRDPRVVSDAASMFGKILRLTADGTTPAHSATPVFSRGHPHVRGLAWHPESGALWDVERSERGDELNHLARLDVQQDVSGFAFTREGGMLVALHDEQDVLLIPPSGTEGRVVRLLHGHFGRIGALTTGPDGAIYVTTANADVWGPRADVVVRLVY